MGAKNIKQALLHVPITKKKKVHTLTYEKPPPVLAYQLTNFNFNFGILYLCCFQNFLGVLWCYLGS